MKSDLVDVTVRKHAETPLAILISDDGVQSNAVWIPKSQCEIERVEDNRVEDSGRSLWTLTLPKWLAKDKGLI